MGGNLRKTPWRSSFGETMEKLLHEIQEALLNYPDNALLRAEVEFIVRKHQAQLDAGQTPLLEVG